MRRRYVFLMAMCILLSAKTASAGIAVVVEHRWTVGNNYFSAFAYDRALQEFRTAGYSFGQDVRWSRIVSDANVPWNMEGDIMLNWFQLSIFATAGSYSDSGSWSFWGMNFNPATGKYIGTGIGILRSSGSGPRLPHEADMVILDNRLPDSVLSLPNGVTLSNVGGIYRLTDASLDPNGAPRARFLSSGVRVGDRITLFAIDTNALVLPGYYTVTQVVSETELRLDRDPSWVPEMTTTGLGYLLSIQPHITLATFRQNIPYYAQYPTLGPKANHTGGLSPDSQTLYVAEIVSKNMLAVNAQVKENFSVFIPTSWFYNYVQAQVAAGRHKAWVAPLFVYADRLDPNSWANQSTGTTVDPNNATPVYRGTRSLAATYNDAGARLVLHSTTVLSAAHYAKLRFMIHGGTTGGQQINLYAYDGGGIPGTQIAIPPPAAGTWRLVEVPVTQLGVATIGGLVWANAFAGPRPTFYMDDIALTYSTPPPPGIGQFDPNGAGPAAAQVYCDPAGRVWFSESEADDILWTTDGVTFHTFLTSNEIAASPQATDPNTTTTGTQVMGLTGDRMGTIYWSDNVSRAIWKAPVCGGAENVRCLATKEQLQTALGFAPRGMNCFTIRGRELLTFNYVDGNFIYKVDLDTFDYGDFDNDVDVDAADLNTFANVMRGPGVVTPPPGYETQFGWADLDLDGDVDLRDARKLQLYATGALPPP